MDDDVDEIQKDPVGDPPAFDVLRFPAAGFEQPLFDRIGDRQRLTRRGSVADDEVVGELADAPQIQNENIVGLFVERGVDDLSQYGFQRGASSKYNR